jgi:hypothetical protein
MCPHISSSTINKSIYLPGNEAAILQKEAGCSETICANGQLKEVDAGHFQSMTRQELAINPSFSSTTLPGD